MTPFEYLLLFAAIILGLAITDLATSIHRLLAAGRRVRWDWLAPMAALVAFLKIVTQWWSWYGVAKIAAGLTFEMFLGVLAASVLLFLLAAAALPDDFGEQAVDLRQYYARVSRRYWLLFVAHWILVNTVDIWAQVAIAKAHLDLIQPGLLVLPVALLLAFTRNRALHTLCLAGFVVVYVHQYLGQSLVR